MLQNGWNEQAFIKDHSVTKVIADAGKINYQEIRLHADRNKLLRAMRNPKDFRSELSKEEKVLQKGDALLLCTDGFWDYIAEDAMCIDYAKSQTPEDWLGIMETRLLTLLREKQVIYNDNYSAIAIFVV